MRFTNPSGDFESPAVTRCEAYASTPRRTGDRETLFRRLTWKHERIMQGAIDVEVDAEPLPNIAREDLDAGKELIDVGACCSTIFTTGNLVSFLKKIALHGKEQSTSMCT